MARDFFILDVFTETPFEGNPLAVVMQSAGLSDAAMQAIAREFNLSETVFVLPAVNPAHTASIRIFTPETELPFAGHPTVGTAVLLASERIWKNGVLCDAIVVLEAKGGVLRVGVRKEPGGAAYAEFDAPKLPEAAGQPSHDDRLAAALGLAPSEIGFENHAPTRFNAGLPFTFVPVANLEAIRRIKVSRTHWREAFGLDGHAAAYVYCRETVKQKNAFHARMFFPGIGAMEDPATGSAAVAFSGVIHTFDAPPDGVYRGVIEQGFEMGRPSEIALEFEVASRRIRLVRIGGHAVIVMRGELLT